MANLQKKENYLWFAFLLFNLSNSFYRKARKALRPLRFRKVKIFASLRLI